MQATPPAYGYEEAFGFAWEATYGTWVAPTNWWRVISNSLALKDFVVPTASSTGYPVEYRRSPGGQANLFRGMPDISGTVVVEAEYDDIGLLLSNAIGEPTSVDNTTYHTHTFTMETAPAALSTSFTAARIHGSTADYDFTGCMINNLEVSAAENRLVTVSMDVIAQTAGETEDIIGTPSAVPYIEMHHSYVRRDDAVGNQPDADDNLDDGNDCVDWTFRIENNLRYIQAAGNGVRGCREPVFAGYRRATITFNKDWLDNTFYGIANNATVASTCDAISIFCDSGTEIGGGQNYDLEIWMPSAVLIERADEYGGGGDLIPETVTYAASMSTGNEILQVTLNNNTDNSTVSGSAYKGSGT